MRRRVHRPCNSRQSEHEILMRPMILSSHTCVLLYVIHTAMRCVLRASVLGVAANAWQLKAHALSVKVRNFYLPLSRIERVIGMAPSRTQSPRSIANQHIARAPSAPRPRRPPQRSRYRQSEKHCGGA